MFSTARKTITYYLFVVRKTQRIAFIISREKNYLLWTVIKQHGKYMEEQTSQHKDQFYYTVRRWVVSC